jgi:predicted Zn-dependent peptidase
MGTVEGLAAITPDDVRAFHRATYHPNGAILAVAGAVDWDRLQTSVDQLFGTWETASEPRLIERPAGPLRDHISKETQQTQIALAVPTVPIGHPDYYLARAAAAILGGYSSARLFTEVREKRGLCYSVYAGYEGFRERAALLGHAGSAPERAQQTLDVTLAEFHRLAAEGVDPHELDTMRAGLKSSLIMQQESTMSRSSSLASDYYFLGRVRSLDEIAGALDALTAEAVSRFAAGLPIDQATILTLGPSPLVLPDSP